MFFGEARLFHVIALQCDALDLLTGCVVDARHLVDAVPAPRHQRHVEIHAAAWKRDSFRQEDLDRVELGMAVGAEEFGEGGEGLVARGIVVLLGIGAGCEQKLLPTAGLLGDDRPEQGQRVGAISGVDGALRGEAGEVDVVGEQVVQRAQGRQGFGRFARCGLLFRSLEACLLLGPRQIWGVDCGSGWRGSAGRMQDLRRAGRWRRSWQRAREAPLGASRMYLIETLQLFPVLLGTPAPVTGGLAGKRSAGDGEGEGEDGAVAELAGDSDGAAVGVDDGAGDGEAHAGAANSVAVVLAAVELVEDHLLLAGVDAGAAVGYADGDHVGWSGGLAGLTGGLAVAGDEDGLRGGGVFDGVFEEVHQDFVDPRGVGEDVGQSGGEGDADLAAGVIGEALFDGGVDEIGDGLREEFEMDLVGVELRHLDGLFDEVVEAVGLFVDDGEEFGAGLSVEGLLGEERADGGLDGGERRAKFMGDGVEQGGAEALAFFGSLGAGGVFEGVGALDRHGDEAAESFHGLARERGGFEQERARGADADVQWDGGGLAFGRGAGDGLGHGFAEIVQERGAGGVGVCGLDGGVPAAALMGIRLGSEK